MGNKSHHYSPPDSFHPQQWQEVPLTNKKKQQGGTYTKLKHRITNQIVEKYEVLFTVENQYREYVQSFNWRLNQQCIVNTRFLREKHSKDLCSTTYRADVYIQNIQTRLSEIKDIPFPENLYVLYSALEGFSKIYHFLGYMRPKQNLICVDSDGYVRVWINDDLSKNYPGSDDGVQTKDRMVQSTMVNQIIGIISSNTDLDSQPISLPQYFQAKNKLHPTFQQAKSSIHQYSRQYKAPIPQRFESILQMALEDQFAVKQSSNNQISSEQILPIKGHQPIPKSNSYLPSDPITRPYKVIVNGFDLFKQHLTTQNLKQHHNGTSHPPPQQQYQHQHQQPTPIIANSGLTTLFNNKNSDLKHSQQVSNTLGGISRFPLPSYKHHNIPATPQTGRRQAHKISHNRANSELQGRQKLLFINRPQSNIQISPLHVRGQQFAARRLLTNKQQYAGSLTFPTRYIGNDNHRDICGIRQCSLRNSPVSNFLTHKRPQAQITFNNGVNYNRHVMLTSSPKMYPLQISIPVPVSRSNFVRFTHHSNTNQTLYKERVQNMQVKPVSRENKHEREYKIVSIPVLSYQSNKLQQSRGLVQGRQDIRKQLLMCPDDLSKRAKATQTRQQTPLKFAEIQEFINMQQKSTIEDEANQNNNLRCYEKSDNHFWKVERQPNYQTNKHYDSRIEGQEKSSQRDVALFKEDRKLDQFKPRQSERPSYHDQENKNIHSSAHKEQSKFYYTITTEQLIDPEIASDLIRYSKLGQL